MTFASETVRLLFHQLPTERQVEFSEMEERLAKRLQRLHIDGVMTDSSVSEVLIRITFDSKAYAQACDRSAVF